MNFLNLTLLAPLALLGGLAIAIPLYLHLRHKPRAIPLQFGALQFLLKAQKKRKRRFKLEQFFLLLMRCLFVLALALIFAQPFKEMILGADDNIGNKPLVMILDNSASMLANNGADSFWDQAKAQVRAILDKRGNTPTLLLISSQPERLVSMRSADEILAALPGLKVDLRRSSLDRAYQEALNIIQQEGWGSARIHILSDGVISAWDQVPSEPASGVEVVTSTFLDADKFSNFGIERVDQIESAESLDLEVRLINGGGVGTTFNVDIKPEKDSPIQHRVNLESHETVSHRFALPAHSAGPVLVSLQEDNFPIDNQVTFIPGSLQAPRIVIVDGDTNPVAQRSESFFVANALQLQFGKEVLVITPAGLNADLLSKTDVLLMLNVEVPPTEWLADYLQKGKGLFISTGNRFSSEAWNAFLQPFDLQFWEWVNQPELVELKQADHPLLQGVGVSDWEMYLSEFQVFSHQLISLGRSQYKAVFTYSDSAPALVCGDTGPGRIAIWPSAMDLEGSNVPIAVGFIPLMRQIVNYLSFRETKNSVESLLVDDVIAQGLEDKLVLKHVNPDFRNLDVQGILPGVYSTADSQFERMIHVFLDPRESDFKPISSQTAGNEAEAFEKLGFKNQLRIDLGPGLLWLVFAIVCMETLAAGFISLRWGQR
ncbi:MAG: BatA domain-containing protein [Acidobacteria bacterium]|nr:BatA and WFA domain-containing protein [Acidobacteriota bacterium]MCB9399495.1 BatA domain-containing protein [Acidobacteriota bacterium]